MKFNKWWTISLTTMLLVSSSIANISNNILSRKEDNYSSLQNSSVNETMSGKEFVNELNNLSESGGGEYNLESDVDLSDLVLADTISISHIVLNGNGHKIYNRTLNNTKEFEINKEAEEKKLYLFNSINYSTIENLTFDNIIFPIYFFNNSHLINVNFENIAYEEMTFIIKDFQVNFNEPEDEEVDTATIGLVILRMENSTFENVEINNITFDNNIIKNNEVPNKYNKTIIVAPIGYIKEQKHSSIIDTPINEFNNIFIQDISFSRNQFNENKLFNWENYGRGSSIDYGNVSSVIFSPTIGGVIGFKAKDSYAKVTSNYVVIDNITFDSNSSEVTFNRMYETGEGQGIFYSLGPVLNVGNQMLLNNTYLFNLNIVMDETDDTLFNTGFITTLNNYGASSKSFYQAEKNYYYQEELISTLLGADTIMFQSTNYETMINNMNIGNPSENLESIWDQNIWSKEKKGSTDLQTIAYHKTPWIDSNNDYQFNEKTTTMDGIFRTGAYKDSQWNISILNDKDYSFYENKNISENEIIKEEFKTSEILDPTKKISIKAKSVTNNKIEFNTLFDSSIFVPKITNLSNQRSDDNKKKLELKIEFINNFNYTIKFQIQLYKKQKLIEKNNKIITNSEENELIVTSNTNFDFSETFEDYYYDINIIFIKEEKEQQIYENIINWDENSLVKYNHFEPKTNWIIIVFSIILILLLIFLVLLIIFFVKKRKNKQKMLQVYEEVTGIELI